jgi:hypothetical protein
MPSIDLGLPSFVVDNWVAYGFSEAYRRVERQLHGADTAQAHDWYSAVLAAMQALNSVSVPAVPALGATTKQYCWAAPTVRLRASGRIGSLQGRATPLRVHSAALITWLQARASLRFHATAFVSRR